MPAAYYNFNSGSEILYDISGNGNHGELNGPSWIKYGCQDELACNYDIQVTIDDESCEYPEENYDCEGNCSVEVDCAGICGGDTVFDGCGECGGDGVDEGACDCDGNVLDCSGECGGDTVIDECGECGGDGIDEGACDCDGNALDCAGECGGSAVIDGSGE